VVSGKRENFGTNDLIGGKRHNSQFYLMGGLITSGLFIPAVRREVDSSLNLEPTRGMGVQYRDDRKRFSISLKGYFFV